MKKISDLISLLNLEKIEENIFRGQNYQAPWGRVFWGASNGTVCKCRS